MATLQDLLIRIGVDTKQIDKTRAAAGKLAKSFEGVGDRANLVTRGVAGIAAGLPALGVGVGFAVSLGAALAGAGAAVGVFGAVTKTAMTEVTEASTKYQDLADKVELYGRQAEMLKASGQDNEKMLKKQASAALELKARLSLLSPPMRDAVENYMDMKGNWQDFVDENKPATFGVLTQGYKLMGSAILQLQPLFDIARNAAVRLITVVQKWVDGGGITRLAATAKPAMQALMSIIINVGKAIGNTFGKFGAEQGQGFLDWLVKITGAWANWTAETDKGQGINKFVEYVQANGPKVVDALTRIADMAVKIAQAVTPLAPITLAVAGALAAMVEAIPQSWITAIVAGMLAYSAAVKVVAAYQAASAAAQVAWNAAQIVGKGLGMAAVWAGQAVRIAAVTVATQAAAAAQAIWTGAMMAVGWAKMAAEMAAYAVKQAVITGAAKVEAAAQWLWNAAMTANPIGLVIAAIALLVAAIIWIATKTTWFQTIWKYVWGFLKQVGAWFAGPFANFFVAVWNKIVAFAKGVWNAIKLYFGFWQGIFKKVMSWGLSAVNYLRDRWNAFIGFVAKIPSKVSGYLSRMWDGLKNGFRAAINWVIGKWNGLRFTIPSFSVLGQSFGGGSIGVPRIPQLAAGGIVKARRGGTLVNVGEGGRDEAVVPLNRAGQFLNRGTEKPPVLVIEGNETDFRRWLAKSIRVKGPIGSTVTFAAAN